MKFRQIHRGCNAVGPAWLQLCVCIKDRGIIHPQIWASPDRRKFFNGIIEKAVHAGWKVFHNHRRSCRSVIPRR